MTDTLCPLKGSSLQPRLTTLLLPASVRVGPVDTSCKWACETYTPVITAAMLVIAKTQKQSICPLTDEQIKKMYYVCAQWNMIQP